MWLTMAQSSSCTAYQDVLRKTWCPWCGVHALWLPGSDYEEQSLNSNWEIFYGETGLESKIQKVSMSWKVKKKKNLVFVLGIDKKETEKRVNKVCCVIFFVCFLFFCCVIFGLILSLILGDMIMYFRVKFHEVCNSEKRETANIENINTWWIYVQGVWIFIILFMQILCSF